MFFINSPEAGFSLRQRLHKPTVIVHYLHLNASRHRSSFIPSGWRTILIQYNHFLIKIATLAVL
jgi:hypothetical protein